jgi:hypothetical protein
MMVFGVIMNSMLRSRSEQFTPKERAIAYTLAIGGTLLAGIGILSLPGGPNASMPKPIAQALAPGQKPDDRTFEMTFEANGSNSGTIWGGLKAISKAEGPSSGTDETMGLTQDSQALAAQYGLPDAGEAIVVEAAAPIKDPALLNSDPLVRIEPVKPS